MTTKTKTIKRSTVDSTVKTGNLVRVKEPNFLTLVGSPAVQRSFVVVRSAQQTGDSKMAGKSKTTVKRIARSAANPVLRLAFPEGTTEDSVNTTLEKFGMMDTYNVTQDEDSGVFIATRSDLQSIAKDTTQEITLTEDGIVATVARAQPGVEEKVEGTGLALQSVEFDLEKISRADAEAWATANSVDISFPEDDNSLASVVVTRSELKEGAEVRQMEIEPGIVLSIIRADSNDLPDGVFEVISEAAYGQWGWGIMDFNAALADEIFTDQVRMGINKLDDVLRQILFYSQLPLDVRKQLATNALSQFSTFVTTYMDTLPRQLLATVARSDFSLEKDMTDKTKAPATKQETKADDAANQTVTRADVEAMVNTAVTTAVTAAVEAIAKRADGDNKEGDEKKEDPAKKPDDEKAITRSDLAGAFSEATKPLLERLEKLEGTTILRSDNDDAALEKADAKKADEKQDDSTIFRGAIGGINRRRSA